MYLNWAKLRFRMSKYKNKFSDTRNFMNKANELIIQLEKRTDKKKTEEQSIARYSELYKRFKMMLETDNDEVIELKFILEQENKIGKLKHEELSKVVEDLNNFRELDGKKRYQSIGSYVPLEVDHLQEEKGFFEKLEIFEDKTESKPKDEQGFFSKLFSWKW